MQSGAEERKCSSNGLAGSLMGKGACQRIIWKDSSAIWLMVLAGWQVRVIVMFGLGKLKLLSEGAFPPPRPHVPSLPCAGRLLVRSYRWMLLLAALAER